MTENASNQDERPAGWELSADISSSSTSDGQQIKRGIRKDISGRLLDQCKSVLLGGLETAIITRFEMANLMLKDCLERRNGGAAPRLVFSSNGQGIALAGEDPLFSAAIQQADLIHADGMSVVLASKIFTDSPLPERVPTTDFFHDAARAGQPHRLRFFMLGGKEEVNREAFDRACSAYPDIEWVGRHHGYFTEQDEERLCAEIVAAQTDVLWLALGRPYQEHFAIRNRDRLKGVGWIKTCGGLFDFLAGVNKRAPRWMQKICMEWFWRMMQEPRRLIWRYMKTNIQAVICLATQSGRRQAVANPSHATQRPYHPQT